MDDLTYDLFKVGNVTISNACIDESVLTRPHYRLADFTTEDGQVYAINRNNNFAYPVIGKRFDMEMKVKNPEFSESRCMTNKVLKLSDLKSEM